MKVTYRDSTVNFVNSYLRELYCCASDNSSDFTETSDRNVSTVIYNMIIIRAA